jgi:hypothetical protein
MYFMMMNYSHTTTCRTNISTKKIVLYAGSSVNGCVSNMLLLCSIKTFFRPRKRVLSMKESSMSTLSMSTSGGYEVHFSINVWADIVGDILMGPYLLPCQLDAQRYCVLFQTVLLGQIKYVPLAV